MEEFYLEAMQAYEKKDFITALDLFSKMNDLNSKAYENKCIDNLEDIIYYAKRKKALEYLKKLEFYHDYSLFVDAYKRRRLNVISKIVMCGSALFGTVILVLLLLL